MLFTVYVAGSWFHSPPVSVALKVMVSVPYQSGLGMLIVAMRLLLIVTVSWLFPVYVHVMAVSGSSMSDT